MSGADKKPILIFDGDCGFCRTWIEHWKSLTGDRVEYAPYQEVGGRYPRIPEKDFRRAVQYVGADGGTASGAKAVFMTLSAVPGRSGWLWAYRHVPAFAPASEAAYRFIARHRPFAARMTRLLWGPRLERSEYVLSRWVFLRALGLLYLIAFLSYFVQLDGLIGHDGILPARNFLTAAARHFGPDAVWRFPTLAWFGASDAALNGIALAGIGLSIAVIAGFAVWPSLALLYAGYLSLTVAGQDFLSFQWDALLLEMGFLALFFAPRGLLPSLRKESRPSAAVRWLFWLLLFRFMWNSGLVKLFSGDPSWRDLTALSYHYFSQPLPNPLSWYMHQLPLWFHKAETFLSLACELTVPFLIFAPRRLRFLGAWIMIAFQAFLELTGNYTAFNLQAITLCLLLFDDQAWRRVLPRRMGEAARKAVDHVARRTPAAIMNVGMLGLMGTLSVLLIASMATGGGRWLGVADAFFELVAPFRIVNVYGPFAVMTKTRPEVIIEGSDDGVEWKEYGFRYKPGDVDRMPPVVAPHHPRLDWQMWFLQFGTWRENPWFFNLMVRLLQGSPDVLALFGTDPFPSHPPKYVRALMYDYRFTTPAEKSSTGAWWHRELKGEYFPMESLDSLQTLFDAPESAGRR